MAQSLKDFQEIYCLGSSESSKKQFHDACGAAVKVVDSLNVLTLMETLSAEHQVLLVLVTGHGYSIPDRNGDEADGRDEMILVNRRGMCILDDEFYTAVQKWHASAPTFARLILLADTCHSGTLFDLPHILSADKCRVVSFSACADDQLSMCDLGEKTGFGGSLTTAILNHPDTLQWILDGRYQEAHRAVSQRLKLLGQKCEAYMLV
jgi:hypothetical protein